MGVRLAVGAVSNGNCSILEGEVKGVTASYAVQSDDVNVSIT